MKGMYLVGSKWEEQGRGGGILVVAEDQYHAKLIVEDLLTGIANGEDLCVVEFSD